MLEGETPEDPEVYKMWPVAMIADRFHVLPSVVARDLDEDPSQLSLRCLELLGYSEVRNAFKNAKDAEALKIWEGPTLDLVIENQGAIEKARLDARNARWNASAQPSAAQPTKRGPLVS